MLWGCLALSANLCHRLKFDLTITSPVTPGDGDLLRLVIHHPSSNEVMTLEPVQDIEVQVGGWPTLPEAQAAILRPLFSFALRQISNKYQFVRYDLQKGEVQYRYTSRRK